MGKELAFNISIKDNIYVISNLGCIWFYGRTREKNYDKAFYYFDRAREMGDLIAIYKMADRKEDPNAWSNSW